MNYQTNCLENVCDLIVSDVNPALHSNIETQMDKDIKSLMAASSPFQ